MRGYTAGGGGGLVGGDSDRFNVIGVPAVDYLVEGLFFVFFYYEFFKHISDNTIISYRDEFLCLGF